jgi:2-amino-4-hydroxy-6-hydroxymethyldihydropteridine diphosphokinase
MDKNKLILALGTNTNQEKNMFMAEHLLRKLLPDIVFTEPRWTQPIGVKSDRFFNELAFAMVNHKMLQIERAIKNIEHKCGSTKAERSKNIIKIDIDILLVGDTKYHIKDWERKYIKELIKQDPYAQE